MIERAEDLIDAHVGAGGPEQPTRSRLLKAVGISGGGDLAAKAALLLTTFCAARLLDPPGFAVYAGLQATAVIAAAIWDAGISTLVVTQGAQNAQPAEIARRVLVNRILTFPLWIGTLAVGIGVFGRLLDLGPGLILTVAISSVGTSLAVPVLAWLRSRLRFGASSGATAAGRWVTCFASLALLFTAAPGSGLLLPLLAAQAVGEFVMLGVAASIGRTLQVHTDMAWDPAAIRLRKSLPFAANSLLSIAYNRLDIVLVATLTTASQVAAYAPATRLQDAMYLLPSALSVVALPYLSRIVSSDNGLVYARLLLRRLWAMGLALATPITLVLIIYMPTVIRVVLGPDYEPATDAARITSLSVLLAVIGAPILSLLIAVGRGSATTRAFLAAFVASVGLHLLLDPRFGSVGAAVASLTRDVANVAVAAWLARDLLRDRRFLVTDRPLLDPESLATPPRGARRS
jgi:O-antigen/teichoic acid export membrane protein